MAGVGVVFKYMFGYMQTSHFTKFITHVYDVFFFQYHTLQDDMQLKGEQTLRASPPVNNQNTTDHKFV